MNEKKNLPLNVARRLARATLGHGVGCCFDTGYRREEVQSMAFQVFDTLSLLRCSYTHSSALLARLQDEPNKQDMAAHQQRAAAAMREKLEEALELPPDASEGLEEARRLLGETRAAESPAPNPPAPNPPAPNPPTEQRSALEQGLLMRLEGDQRSLRLLSQMLIDLRSSAPAHQMSPHWSIEQATHYDHLLEMAHTASALANSLLHKHITELAR